MRLTIISLIMALAAFGDDAKICITNAAGLEKCRTITADAWKAAQDLANGSCTTIAGTPERTWPPVIPAVAPVTTCNYVSAYDVFFQHLRGYLRDLLVQYPGPALVPLKKAVADAQKALDAEQAKAALSVGP